MTDPTTLNLKDIDIVDVPHNHPLLTTPREFDTSEEFRNIIDAIVDETGANKIDVRRHVLMFGVGIMQQKYHDALCKIDSMDDALLEQVTIPSRGAPKYGNNVKRTTFAPIASHFEYIEDLSDTTGFSKRALLTMAMYLGLSRYEQTSQQFESEVEEMIEELVIPASVASEIQNKRKELHIS